MLNTARPHLRDITAADFDTMAAQRKSQGEEEEGDERSRLALQNAAESR